MAATCAIPAPIAPEPTIPIIEFLSTCIPDFHRKDPAWAGPRFFYVLFVCKEGAKKKPERLF